METDSNTAHDFFDIDRTILNLADEQLVFLISFIQNLHADRRLLLAVAFAIVRACPFCTVPLGEALALALVVAHVCGKARGRDVLALANRNDAIAGLLLVAVNLIQNEDLGILI